ncbi:hypothetical protein KA183_02340 [bacterium]|nr:hypothetical protein [bacterium]
MTDFHARLLELESERLAKEEVRRGVEHFTPECHHLLESVAQKIGVKLGDPVPSDWQGWICYYRKPEQFIVLRGRAFKGSGLFGKHKAGLDIPLGGDSINDYSRKFDVTPPQELDHLMVNFGVGDSLRVFLWYGENIAAYRLIYEAEVDTDPHNELADAVAEACAWILQKPKEKTLPEYLASLGR